MCNSKPIIKLNQVDYKVGNHYLLRNIDWNICEGEKWLVFGMNGCGKTTLLSMIAGIIEPTHGTISVYQNNADEKNNLFRRKKIALISSSYFDKHYSGEFVEDIVLSGKYGTLGIRGMISVSDRKRARALLAELGLKHCMNLTFDMLSKGERQNVLIAKAFMARPEVLLLDEPCTGLDIYNREYLFRTLEQLAEYQVNPKMTMIYVTHYVEEIHPMFDQCILMQDGKIAATGNTKDVFTEDYLKQLIRWPLRMDERNGKRSISLERVESNIVKYLMETDREGGYRHDC